METNLVILQKEVLRSLAKNINALKLQIIQMENIIQELRIKMLEGGKNENRK